MRKLIFLILLGLAGFYVAWPAWSGWQLYQAIEKRDAALLEAKVDFPAVRESLRPVVTAQVEKQLDQQLQNQGSGGVGGILGGALGGDLKKQLVPRLTDQVLQTMVTPQNVIRIIEEGANAAALQKVISEQMQKLGGAVPGLPAPGGASGGGGAPAPGGLGSILGKIAIPGVPGLGGGGTPAPAPAPQPQPQQQAAKPVKFGIGNIKGFAFDGPLAFAVSVARDAAAAKPELTAGMTFKNMDWKVTRVVPHL